MRSRSPLDETLMGVKMPRTNSVRLITSTCTNKGAATNFAHGMRNTWQGELIHCIGTL